VRRLLRSARLVAHVGWTGSRADRERREIVEQHEDALGSELRLGVKFDLAYQGPPDAQCGADFLRDSRTFDVVVLHWIFGGWDELECARARPAIANHFAFALSDQHSADAWRRRLRRSGAERIYVFGGICEVSGSWLLDIPGYRKRYASFGTIYERAPATSTTCG
jgi:hypothetical protein